MGNKVEYSTFIRKPIINFELPNKDGVKAEVKVTTGYAHIEEINKKKPPKNKSKSKVMAKIMFTADNTKWPIGAWTTIGSDVYNLVEKAEQAGVPIHFRIETFRKKDVDPNIPIFELTSSMEVAKNSVIHNLSAVKLDEQNDWILSDQILTRIEDDYNNSNTRVNNIYEAGPVPENIVHDDNSNDEIEAPPFKLYNKNGSLNLGSNAITAVSGIYSYVHKYCREKDITLSEVELRKIVVDIFNLCGRVQVDSYKIQNVDMSPDPMCASHTRIRGIIFELLETMVLSNSIIEQEDEYNEFMDKLYKQALSVIKFCAGTIITTYKKEK